MAVLIDARGNLRTGEHGTPGTVTVWRNADPVIGSPQAAARLRALPVRHRFVDVAAGVAREKTDAEKAAADTSAAVEARRSAATRARLAKRGERIAAGVTVAGDTYSITDEAVERWSRLSASLREEVDAGETARGDRVKVFDRGGSLKTPTVEQARSLLGRIGRVRRLIDEADLDWTRQIAAASDVATLDAIIAEIGGA